MIYAFLKTNNFMISYEEQQKAVDELANKLNLHIDRYIIDNYSRRYGEPSLLMMGMGSGSFYHNFEEKGILLVHSLYCLTFRHKTTLFVIKELLKKQATIYSADGAVLAPEDRKVFEIDFKLKCDFDQGILDRTLIHAGCMTPLDLEPYKDEIQKDLLNNVSFDVLRRKYGCARSTLVCFIRTHGLKHGRYITTMNRKAYLGSMVEMQKRYATARGIEIPKKVSILEIENKF